MNKTITGAFARPFGGNGSHERARSARQAHGAQAGSLTTHELRLLVAGMVD